MRGGGGRGGGGGGGTSGGSSDGDAAFIRRLRALFDRGAGGGGGGGGARGPRGGRDTAARGRGGGAAPLSRAAGGRPRPEALVEDRPIGAADWVCGRCGFEPNFARRRHCFDCGAPRSGASAVGAAPRPPARVGPVGDGGRRPMLAWGNASRDSGRRQAVEPPTRRTPGASVAAIVEAARRDAARADAAGTGGGGGPRDRADPQPARSSVVEDEEGFVTVGKGGKPAKTTMAAATPAQGMVGGVGHGGGPAGTRPAPATRAAEHDGEEAPGGKEGGDADLDDDDAPQRDPDPDKLRRRWMEEVALVRQLARQGLPEGHPALLAAHAARDAAEATWRQAKQPAPVATRLRWAQAKLAKAVEMAEATTAAIAKAEEEHEKVMAQLHDRRILDGERVRKRQAAVRDLQQEIGGDDSTARDAGCDAAAMLEACGGLCNTIGPELLALAERLPAGSDEWRAVNQVLATLATSQRRMEEAAGVHAEQPPQEYDIGDAEEDDLDGMSVATPWSESHELGHDQRPVVGSQANGDVESRAAPPGNSWGDWGQASWSNAQWRADQHGRWHRSSWADQWEAEHGQAANWGTGLQEAAQGARRGCGEHDAESGEPSAKHRRQAPGHPATTDGTAANATGGEPARGAQATAATLGMGQSPAAPPAEVPFEKQVAEVVERAVSQGVQPITDEGHDLITLSPALLARWVSDKLENGSTR